MTRWWQSGRPAWLGLLAVIAFAPTAARAAPPADAVYRVVSGDSLQALAARYLVPHRTYRDLQRLNHVGNPRRLIPGRLLRIPRSWLRGEPSSAELTAMRGGVAVEIASKPRRAMVGMQIPQRSTLATQSRSFASLQLQDGSQLTVLPESRIRIATLQKVVLTGSIERTFEVEQGRMQARITPMSDPGSTFELRTPLVLAAVRGTEYRTTFDPVSQVSRIEVLKGRVEVSGASRAMITAGEGMLVDMAGLGAPQPLLAAPTLLNPGHVQSEEQLHFGLRSQPGAAGYHALIAADAGFVELLDEALITEPDLVREAPGEGTYFLRLSAVSDKGLEGLSRDYAFERRHYAFGASFEMSGEGPARRYLFRWQKDGDARARFHFILRRQAAAGPPLVDEVALEPNEIAISGLAPGTYVWKVGRVLPEGEQTSTRWDDERELVVSAPR